MAELEATRKKLIRKLGIGDQHLRRLIRNKVSSTLLTRRLAILALASENGVNLPNTATPEELSQLRAIVSGAPEPVPLSSLSSGANSPRRSQPSAKKSGTAAKSRKRSSTTTSRGRTSQQTVFVVHGRNEPVRRSIFQFLRSLGLKPIEWHEAIGATRKTNPTIHEILEGAFKKAIAVVVVLTPDDSVTLKKAFRKPTDEPYEAKSTGQARPNVLFEAGMAMGWNPDRTILVQVGRVKPFSDVGGRHVTALTNTAESRTEFITKLRNAKCIVNTNGSDWLSEGDFRP